MFFSSTKVAYATIEQIQNSKRNSQFVYALIDELLGGAESPQGGSEIPYNDAGDIHSFDLHTGCGQALEDWNGVQAENGSGSSAMAPPSGCARLAVSSSSKDAQVRERKVDGRKAP